ncbi:MAG: autotransporter outer membrane beta-barrel domain-containing protein, partial [Desulfobacterales bacterium]|nr:autotransporter outer membrane beta-barrel domain-containing protein [Desulfobacterales bacterium]
MKAFAVFWLGVILTLVLSVQWGRAGKLVGNVVTEPQNTAHITTDIYWKTTGSHFFVGLAVTDSTSYSPDRTFTNTGNITLINAAHNTPNTIVLLGNDNADVKVVNRGDLYLSMGPNDMGNFAYGINAEGDLVNQGRINFNYIRQGSSYLGIPTGIECRGDTMVNTGELDLFMSGGVNTVGSAGIILGEAIDFSGNSLTNTANINIETHGGDVTGLGAAASSQAVGVKTMGTFSNTGTITVKSVGGRYRLNTSTPYTGDTSNAIGIQAVGNLTLHSQGLIKVQALQAPGTNTGSTMAKQIRVSNGTTTTVTGYAMELDNQADFTQTYHGTISLLSGASAVFSNATLYLKIAQDFDGQTEYEIPMLVENAVTADQFVQLGPVPPEYKVALVDGNGAALQKLAVEFVPEASVPLASAQAQNTFNARGHTLVNDHITSGVMSELLPAEAIGLSFLDHPRQVTASLVGSKFSRGAISPFPLPETDRLSVFVSPMLLFSKDDSDMGYEAENYGILAGATQAVGKSFYAGFHAGVNTMDIDFKGAGSEFRHEMVHAYSLGGHGMKLLYENWLVTAIGSLFYSDTDYWDRSPQNLESASYSGYSARMDLSVGRLIHGDGYALFPELGFSYAWNRREAFSTDNLSNPDVHHGEMDESEFHLNAGIKAFG